MVSPPIRWGGARAEIRWGPGTQQPMFARDRAGPSAPTHGAVAFVARQGRHAAGLPTACISRTTTPGALTITPPATVLRLDPQNTGISELTHNPSRKPRAFRPGRDRGVAAIGLGARPKLGSAASLLHLKPPPPPGAQACGRRSLCHGAHRPHSSMRAFTISPPTTKERERPDRRPPTGPRARPRPATIRPPPTT